jgi:acetyl esterase
MRRHRVGPWVVPALIVALSAAALTAWAQGKPQPDEANIRYGPHERNVLDLWRAKSDRPTPLLIYIHGGGFRHGDKTSLSPELLGRCLASGLSVAAINYRLSSQATFPAPMHDGALAVQFLRSQASRWNLDPERFAATGDSAGAGISLWVGFHDDLAEPSSDDPVARQSSRLACVAVIGAQSTYDPRVIKSVIGGRAHEHPALRSFYGLTDEEMDSDRAHALYEEASPINLVSPGDPPVFLFYSEPAGDLPAGAPPGQGIHHPRFGTFLRQRLDPLGIKCVLRHRDEYAGQGGLDGRLNRDLVDFLIDQFPRKSGL